MLDDSSIPGHCVAKFDGADQEPGKSTRTYEYEGVALAEWFRLDRKEFGVSV